MWGVYLKTFIHHYNYPSRSLIHASLYVKKKKKKFGGGGLFLFFLHVLPALSPFPLVTVYTLSEICLAFYVKAESNSYVF